VREVAGQCLESKTAMKSVTKGESTQMVKSAIRRTELLLRPALNINWSEPIAPVNNTMSDNAPQKPSVSILFTLLFVYLFKDSKEVACFKSLSNQSHL
jgi:hypothetical protein